MLLKKGVNSNLDKGIKKKTPLGAFHPYGMEHIRSKGVLGIEILIEITRGITSNKIISKYDKICNVIFNHFTPIWNVIKS